MQLHINDWTGRIEEDGAAGEAGGAGGVGAELIDFVAETGTKVLAMLGQENDEVGVTLVTDADIHQMNLEHRGIDAPTDVLSFALDDDDDADNEAADGDNADDDAADDDDAYDDSDYNAADALAGMPHLVGDIVISVERAIAQSKEYGHSLQREIGFLLIHGLLHLYGYDHIEEQDRIVMRAEEERILAALGLGRDIPETPHTSR